MIFYFHLYQFSVAIFLANHKGAPYATQNVEVSSYVVVVET